jgi:hypothetical protein
MPHVRIQRLATGDGQNDRAEDQHAMNAVAEEEARPMVRR